MVEAEIAELEANIAKLEYEEETPAQEAAKGAQAETEWRAQEVADLAKPAHTLSVKISAHPGKFSQSPGYTNVRVVASAYAHVTIKLRRYGHVTFTLDLFRPESESGAEAKDRLPLRQISPNAKGEIKVPWSCGRPGGTYTYTITAKTNVGRTLIRRGTFKPISVARCHELKRHEQEARERNARMYNEEVARRVRAEREELRREEANCRTLNGTPVTVQTGEGPERVCRGPEGYVPL